MSPQTCHRVSNSCPRPNQRQTWRPSCSTPLPPRRLFKRDAAGRRQGADVRFRPLEGRSGSASRMEEVAWITFLMSLQTRKTLEALITSHGLRVVLLGALAQTIHVLSSFYKHKAPSSCAQVVHGRQGPLLCSRSKPPF